MMTNKKIHLQCGYEDVCKKHNCMKCGFQYKEYNFKMSLAEAVVIEDFAVCDLPAMIREKPKEVALMQDVLRKVMKKVYAEDK